MDDRAVVTWLLTSWFMAISALFFAAVLSTSTAERLAFLRSRRHLLVQLFQLGFVAQGMMLAVSGVYYPVSVMPGWMQAIAKISPATYALRGIRHAILDGAGITSLWGDIWPLIIIGLIAFPLGVWIFKQGEVYAKKHGKLKRSG